MVKDYTEAMKIAKDHGYTCVTPELQVVYAGAFVTRVGKDGAKSNSGNSSNRVTLYSLVSEMRTKVSEQASQYA